MANETVRISIDVDPKLRTRLYEMAKSQGMLLQAYLRRILEDAAKRKAA